MKTRRPIGFVSITESNVLSWINAHKLLHRHMQISILCQLNNSFIVTELCCNDFRQFQTIDGLSMERRLNCFMFQNLRSILQSLKFRTS